MYDTARLSLIWLALAILLPACHSSKKAVMVKGFDKQGHRGARGLMPENTIPAMIRAIDLGVTTLEMDAVISRDKKVVVSHDPYFSSLISLTPEGRTIAMVDEKKYALYQMDYADISKWDVGSKPHPLFPKQEKMKIVKPLLEELIDSVEAYTKRKGLTPQFYNIETKCSPSGDGTFHPGPEEFTDLLVGVIQRKKIVPRVTIQSFDERTLQVLHRKYPQITTAYLIEGSETRTVQQNIAVLGFKPDIYSPEYKLVTPELVAYCKAEKIRLIPWTVNNEADIKRLRAMGVDGIISDYPDLFNR